jgi:hypothetical protein
MFADGVENGLTKIQLIVNSNYFIIYTTGSSGYCIYTCFYDPNHPIPLFLSLSLMLLHLDKESIAKGSGRLNTMLIIKIVRLYLSLLEGSGGQSTDLLQFPFGDWAKRGA